MKIADRISAILLGAFALAMIEQASHMKSMRYQLLSESLFPNIVFGMILVLSVVLFAQTFQRGVGKASREYWTKFAGSKRLIILGLFVGYLVLISYLGFLVSTGVFVVATAAVFSPDRRKGIPISLAIAAGLMAGIYGLFVVWLEVLLP